MFWTGCRCNSAEDISELLFSDCMFSAVQYVSQWFPTFLRRLKQPKYFSIHSKRFFPDTKHILRIVPLRGIRLVSDLKVRNFPTHRIVYKYCLYRYDYFQFVLHIHLSLCRSTETGSTTYTNTRTKQPLIINVF